MRNKGKTLAVCMFAAAWWGVFYPELCFTEETCKVVQTGETDGNGVKTGSGETDEIAGEIWRTGSDEIVISSRFLEWCEECLTAGKE